MGLSEDTVCRDGDTREISRASRPIPTVDQLPFPTPPPQAECFRHRVCSHTAAPLISSCGCEFSAPPAPSPSGGIPPWSQTAAKKQIRQPRAARHPASNANYPGSRHSSDPCPQLLCGSSGEFPSPRTEEVEVLALHPPPALTPIHPTLAELFLPQLCTSHYVRTLKEFAVEMFCCTQNKMLATDAVEMKGRCSRWQRRQATYLPLL